MFRSIGLMIFLVFNFLLAEAQQSVYWASRVVEVSSEWSHYQFSAAQALGKPNVFPGYGDNPNAWKPLKDYKDQFIVVMFESPIQARQVAIAESLNPGSVTRIFAYDTDQKEHLLFQTEPRDLPIKSRLLNIFFEKTEYKIEALRVELDVTAVPGDHSIDAIGISDSRQPVRISTPDNPLSNHIQEANKMSSSLNSEYEEHGPLLSPDGDRIYFSRKSHPGNIGGREDLADIWYAELDIKTGEWLPAKNLGPPLNNIGPNFIWSIVPDGQEQVLFLGNEYGKKGKMFSGISWARMMPDGSITLPQDIVIRNNYNYSPQADYFMTRDQMVLLMSVERDDSEGGRDLYVSFNMGKKWTEPENMGSVINTAGDDISPYMDPEGKTLYYSSTGFSGFGGFDIYKSTRLDNSWLNWSEARNMGEVLNSPYDDLYLHFLSGEQNSYFVRSDPKGDADVFEFRSYNATPDVPVKEEESAITAFSDQVLNTLSDQPIKDDNVEKLDAREKGIDHLSAIVFFGFNEVHLTKDDRKKLTSLLPHFRSGRIKALEIHAHSDSVGTSSYNLALSWRRGHLVKRFFTHRGIAGDRISIIAEGETNPLVPNSSEKNRAINRRVEFKFKLSW